jgi:hypothetical protein
MSIAPFIETLSQHFRFGDICMEKIQVYASEHPVKKKKVFLISLVPELGIFGSAKLRPNQLSSMAARVCRHACEKVLTGDKVVTSAVS